MEAFNRGDEMPPGVSKGRTAPPPPGARPEPPPRSSEPPPPPPPREKAGGAPPGTQHIENKVDTEPVKFKMRMPDIVELLHTVAKKLGLPEFASVVRRFRESGVMGKFHPDSHRIEILASIFKDPAQAARTLAHEIGHFVDSIPDTIRRGNILGSLASLKGYVDSMIDELPGSDGRRRITQDEKDAWWKDARARNKDAKGRVDVAAATRDFYSRYEAELRARRMVKRDTVMRELKSLSQAYKPFDEGDNADYTRYRYSARELYADAFSALLNDPELVKKQAPTFHSLFFNYLLRKPEVKATYEEIGSRINDPEAWAAHHQGRVEEMVGGETTQQAHKDRLLEERQHPRTAMEDIKRAVVSVHQYLRDMRGRAAKLGEHQLAVVKSALLAVRKMKTGNAGNIADFLDFHRNVLEPIDQAGLTRREVGSYLFYNRILNDRSQIANPLGVTPEDAAQLRARIVKKWGAAKTDAIDRGLKKWRDEVREPLIRRLIDSGAISKALGDKMLSNKDYVTFSVLDYIRNPELAKASGLDPFRSQYGTLKQIGDPLFSTLLNDFMMRHVALRTEAANRVIAAADIFGEARRVEKGKYGFEKPADGRGLIYVMRDGKAVAYDVPEGLAHSFDHLDDTYGAALQKVDGVTRIVKMAFTTHNPAFVVWNIQRDLRGSFMNLPGWHLVHRATSLISALFEIEHAFNFNKGDFTDTETKIMRAGGIYRPGAQVWETTGERQQRLGTIAGNPDFDAIDVLSDKIGANTHAYERAVTNPVRKLRDRLLSVLSSANDQWERTSKVAGWKYLERAFPDMPIEQRADLVLNRTGTPNASEVADVTRFSNNLSLFSNIGVRGLDQAAESYRDNRTEYLLKGAAMWVAPAIALAAAKNGLFPGKNGEDLKKFFGMVSRRHLSLFDIIPLGWTKEGKPVYMRLPQDHLGQLVHGMAFLLADRAMNQQGHLDAREINNVVWSTLPFGSGNLNPLLTAAGYVSDFMGGQVPRDAYHGRDVLTPTDVAASDLGGAAGTVLKGAWPSLHGGRGRLDSDRLQSQVTAGKKVAEAAWNEVGSSLWQFEGSTPREIQGELERKLHEPVIGPLMSRFLTVSDAGAESSNQEQLAPDRARIAQDRETVARRAGQFFHDNPDATAQDAVDYLDERGVSNPYDGEGRLRAVLEALRVRAVGTPEERQRKRYSAAEWSALHPEENP
jgi:hypothetical protein